MRRLSLVFVLILVTVACSAESWDRIYAARLEASATYLESKLALKTAELAFDRFMKPYLPTVTLATSTGAALSLGSDGFTAGILTPSLTFENILGADFSLKAPLKASSSGGITLGNPSVSITRDLFTETGADCLDAEAGVMTAKAAIKKAKDTVRIDLAMEILNAIYHKRFLEVNKENLVVLERVRKATVDATLLRELERRILGAQKSVLIASNALANLDDDIKNNAESLYEDVLRMQATWTASIEENEPKSTMSIRALELSLEAADKRKSFAILPYLPNPKLTTSLSYDMDNKRIDWGLSISLSYDAIDKGENSLNVLKREEYPKIISLKLGDARKDLSDGIRKTKETLKILDLDKKLQELDIADAQDDVTLLERLFNGGYASEEDLVITQIDLYV
ncbi:MAG TPA: TolC family protein, partial [Rectinemataceae bacterium]|nr:TolC family protein [Rectinemataceae bacterium]